MTTAQRLALAAAFERLQQRIAAQTVVLPHPVIQARKSRVVNRSSRRGPYKRREEKYIAE